MKRLRLLLLLLAVTTMVPLAAATFCTVGGLAFQINESAKTAIVVTPTVAGSSIKYTGDIKIPETISYNGQQYTVITVYTIAFTNTSITSVVIPKTVTTIGGSAFQGCTSLKRIEILGETISITIGAFNGCSALESLVLNCKSIPSNFKGMESIKTVQLNEAETITGSAFDKCKGLTSVYMPKVKTINAYAFRWCTSLSSLTLPEGLTGIGAEAFRYCPLSTIALPESLSIIEDNAFSDCGLTSVIIPSSVTFMKANSFSGNKLESVEFHCESVGSWFKNQTTLTNVVFDEGVKTIAASAFAGCTGLTSISIPSSVTRIGPSAFSKTNISTVEVHCSNVESWFNELSTLTRVDLGNGVRTIGDDAFLKCSNLKTITFPEGLTSIGGRAFQNCALTEVKLPSTLTKIGNQAFQNCTALVDVLIPSSVTEIGYNAFSNTNISTIELHCSNVGKWFRELSTLTRVDLGDEVRTIGDNAFQSCSNLKAITLPEGLTSIGYRAFQGSGLTKVTLPSTLTTIGGQAFQNCTALGDVLMPNVKLIGDNAFQGCTSLSRINLPNTLTDMGFHVFDGCTNLETIEVHCNISGNWFDGMTTLKQVVLGDEVKEIAPLTFYKCTSLTDINLPNGLTTIGYDAFYECPITSLVLPNSATSIANSAFRNSQLQSVELHTSTVGKWFSGITTLTKVTLSDEMKEIGERAFDGCTNLATVNLPAGLATIGSYAFDGCKSLKTIIANMKTPPTAPTNFGETYKTATLRVPYGRTPVYKETLNWKYFFNIEEMEPQPGDVTGLVLNETSLTMIEGTDKQLIATIIPSDATDKGVTWSSSDPTVATVTDGTVTAIKAGTTTITCTSLSNPTATASCVVTVEKPFVAVTGITLSETTLTMPESTSHPALTATVLPADATDPSVKWTTGDAATVSIGDDLSLTAMKAGKTELLCTSVSNAAVSQKVAVEVTAAQVAVSSNSLTLTEGDEQVLTATVAPADQVVQTVTWESSDPSVATVDADGKVTALKAGAADITCIWTWNAERRAACVVTVKPPYIAVDQLTLDKTSVHMTEGDTVSIAATVLPENATDQRVVWTSADSTVVTVTADGALVAVNGGMTTVTCTSVAHPQVQAVCSMSVMKQFVPPVPAPLSTSARAEYFFDTDPGFGQGKGIVVADYDSLDYELDLGGLKAGAHIIYIRCCDEYGRWSSTVAHPLYVQPYQGFLAMEYFYDYIDPGYGQARKLPTPEGSDCEMVLSLPTRELAPGVHTLNVRGLRPNGTWSDVTTRQFLVVERPAEPGNLEYFFDTDPGYGLGQSVDVTTGKSTVAIDLGSLQPGAHILYLRNRDEEGRWSATVSRPLYVCSAIDITRLEYFFDTADPGEGQAVQVSLPDDKLGEFAFEADASKLEAGEHQLNVRACDSKGLWTLVSSEPFTITETDTGVRTLTADFAFSIETANGQCLIAPLGNTRRNDCRVEVVGVDGRVLATAHWPAAQPRVSLDIAAHRGTVVIVRIRDAGDGRCLTRRIVVN